MSNSLNTKVKEQFDHDDSGGSLNTNHSDFLDSESASGNSINTQWRDWSSGTGVSLNNRLMNKHGGTGSFNTRWKNWVAFSSTHSFNFDGSNDYLELNGTLESVFQGAFTVSAWIKPDDGNPSGINALFGSDSIGDQDRFRVMLKTDGKIGLLYKSNNNNAGTIDADTTSAVFSDGATDWTHIAVTLSQSGGTVTGTIYINGSSVAGTFSGSQTMADFATTTNFAIGGANRAGSLTQHFDGLIDEVAIWDTALSSSDITSVYNNGKIIDLSKSASYGVDRTGNLKLWLRCGDKAEPETSIARQDFYTDFDGSNDSVDCGEIDISGSKITLSAWAYRETSDTDDTIAGKWNANGSMLYVSAGQTSVRFYINGNLSSATFPTGAWTHIVGTLGDGFRKLYINGELKDTDADTNSIVNPTGSFFIGRGLWSGGKEFHGSISSVSLYKTTLDAQTISQMAKSRFTPMRDNRFSVVDFDGSNDYIALDSDISLTGEFTFNFWLSTNTSGTNYLVSKGSPENWIRFDSANSNAKLAIDGTSSSFIASLSTPSDGSWFYFSITRDSSNVITAYVDGVQDGNTITQSGTFTINEIGRFSSAEFAGQMGNVTVYNTAKSAEEVYAIYQQGITYDESSLSGLVGYWRMGDDTSKAFPTIADSSSNSNDGTMTNMALEDIQQQMVAGYDLGAFENSSEELGAEKVDNNTTSAYGGGSESNIANVTNGVAITFAGVGTGLNATFSDSSLLNTNIVATENKIHKLTFNAYYEGGSAGSKIRVYDTVRNHVTPSLTTTSTSYSLYFSSIHAGMIFQQVGMTSGNVVYITDMSFKRVLQSEVSDTHPAIIDVNEPVLGADVYGRTDSSSFTAGSGAGQWSGGTVTSSSVAGGATLNGADPTLSTSVIYRVQFICTITSGSFDIRVGSTSTGTNSTGFISSSGTYGFNIIAGASNHDVAIIESSWVGSITSFSIKQIQGNVGTMQNQASSDLVYSSVLPDQSFLTGVNSAYNFVSLDGTNDYIDLPTPLSHTIHSISVWVKKVDTGGNPNLFDARSGTSNGIRLCFNSSEAIIYRINSTVLTSPSNGYKESWNHIVGTYDGTTQKLYVDSELVISQATSETVSNNTNAKLANRSFSTTSSLLTGDLGQFAFYNKELSSTEVSAIYNAGRHTNLLDSYSDNLKAYYAFGALDAVTGLSDTTTTIFDRSGNSNHGTPVSIASADLKSPPNAEPEGYAKGDTNRSTTTP